jgi:hypothetical protein
MGLEIVFRPQKDLYATNPPTAYDEPYYNSRWVSGHLPIQYKISNTKWPLNTDDDTDNVCTVSDVNGFAQLNLCGTYETYVEKEYIKIEDSSVDSYNGVWQILDVVNSTTITISAAYDGVATGAVQRYYNNYHNLVKVYAGIPSYHQFESEDEMSLIATLKIAPNSENISIADISGLVQAKLNCDNDLGQISIPNDLNAWTGFYIDYAESYDKSDGTEVTTFTSSYTTDNNTDCTATQLVQNGDFPTNLNHWVNGSTGASWVWAASKASVTKGANTGSKELYQEVSFLKDVQYNIRASFTNNEAAPIRIRLRAYTNTSLSTGIVITGNTNSSPSFTVDFNFTPSKDYDVLSIRMDNLLGSVAQTVTVDNVSATVSDCTYYGFALNGTRQFQNLLGGNFGDYVQNFNTDLVLNKFLSHFVSPIWFNSLYFDLSTIIPSSTFSSTEDGSLYYYIKEYTEGGGYIERQDISLEAKDDGVYRLPISDLTLDEDTENFDVQIYQLPTNKLTQGSGGTFEYSDDPAGAPPSDWNLTTGSFVGTIARSGAFSRTGNFSLIANSIGGFIAVGEHTIWSTSGGFDVQANSDYIIEGYVYFNTAFPAPASNFDGMQFGFLPVGITESFRSFAVYRSTSLGTWLYSKTVFNTGANTSVNIKAIANAFISAFGSNSMYFDDITVKGPIENLSEIKNIRVDNSCTKQNIYLTWLNNLGGWEYYNFKAQKEYGIGFGDSTAITRDVFNNWDTDFISGETQDDYISIEAYETVLVRSQFMSSDEINAVKNIKYAIRVQHVTSEESKVTVLVDKTSFKINSDGDKLYQIEFEIRYPKIQIQKQ